MRLHSFAWPALFAAPDYVMPYLLTGFCVALGLIMICKPTRRTFDVRKLEIKE